MKDSEMWNEILIDVYTLIMAALAVYSNSFDFMLASMIGVLGVSVVAAMRVYCEHDEKVRKLMIDAERDRREQNEEYPFMQ